jgi:RNA recognition motif-containing protein
VGNLSWDVAWQDLKDHMKQAGEVVHAEVMSDLHSGRSKGCGVVEFATDEGAHAAIETLTNTELKGRTIFVREDRESAGASVPARGGGGGGPGGGRNQPSNPNVYVWNLAPETSWQDLKDHMRKAGNVDSASVFPSPDGGNGSGIVIYQRAQDAARAIRELQGTELHGVAMSLREDRMHSHSGRGGPGRGGGGGGGGRGGRGGGRAFGSGRGGAGGGGESGTQLYVGNLSFDTTWRELKDHFRQCGDIKRAEVKSKGFGTVVFVKKEDADAAIHRLNGSELQGRKLEVRLDQKGH